MILRGTCNRRAENYTLSLGFRAQLKKVIWETVPKNGESNEKTTENEMETGFELGLYMDIRWFGGSGGLGYISLFGSSGLNCWGGD